MNDTAVEPKKNEQPKTESRQLTPIAMGGRGLQLTNLEDAWRFASYVIKAGMGAGHNTPEQVIVAMQCGAELGLTPMQAIQNIYVVNGRPTVFGDALPGLVQSTGMLADFREYFEHQGQKVDRFPEKPDATTCAVCFTMRKGMVNGRETKYSVADAKTAGLWGKVTKSGLPTPWVTNPGRMLQWRARTWNFRDQFADVLKGLSVREEIEDFQPAILGQAEPPRERLSLKDIGADETTITVAPVQTVSLREEAWKAVDAEFDALEKLGKPKTSPEARTEEFKRIVADLFPRQSEDSLTTDDWNFVKEKGPKEIVPF